MPANNPEDLPAMATLETAMLETHKAMLAEIDKAAAKTELLKNKVESKKAPMLLTTQPDVYAQMAALYQMAEKDYKATYLNSTGGSNPCEEIVLKDFQGANAPLAFFPKEPLPAHHKDHSKLEVIGVDYAQSEAKLIAHQQQQHIAIDYQNGWDFPKASDVATITQLIEHSGTYKDSVTGQHFYFGKGTIVTLYNAPPGASMLPYALAVDHELPQPTFKGHHAYGKSMVPKKKVGWSPWVDPNTPVWKDEYANPAYVNRAFEGTAPLVVQGAGSGGLVDDILGACDDG